MNIKKLPVIEYFHIPTKVKDYFIGRREVPANDIYLSYYVGQWALSDEAHNPWDDWLMSLDLELEEKILVEISW